MDKTDPNAMLAQLKADDMLFEQRRMEKEQRHAAYLGMNDVFYRVFTSSDGKIVLREMKKIASAMSGMPSRNDPMGLMAQRKDAIISFIEMIERRVKLSITTKENKGVK